MHTLAVRLLLVLFCVMVLGCQLAFAQPGGAGEPPPLQDVSSVKLDKLKSTNLGGGKYRITATGKITLGKDHEWKGFEIKFKDKNFDYPTPKLITFAVPNPGQTTEFEYQVETSITGDWTVFVDMYYIENKEEKPAFDIGFITLK